jgi:tetratricopeptide (TPR) repeat protein
MDLVFQWTDRSYSLPKEFAHEKRVLSIELDPRWNLSFGLFKQDRVTNSDGKPGIILPMWDHARAQTFSPPDTTDYELYATYRMNARNAIIDGNEQEAERNFVKAADIYDRDPDLYVIYFEYLNAIKDEGKLKAIKDLHLMILNRLLDFFPDHFMFLLSRAEINSIRQHPDVSIAEYKRLMERYPDSLMVIYQLADVYRRADQAAASKKCIRQIEKMYPSVQERLKTGRGSSVDPIAVNEQLRLNDKVMEMIEKKSTADKETEPALRKKSKVG